MKRKIIIKSNRLQKKYGINCEIGGVFTLDKNGKLHNILAELQEKIGFGVYSISLSKGFITSITMDKNIL